MTSPAATPETTRSTMRFVGVLTLALAIVGAVFVSLWSEPVEERAPVASEPVAPPPEIVAKAPAVPEREAPAVAAPKLDRRGRAIPEAPQPTDRTRVIWGHVKDSIDKAPIEYFHTYCAPADAGDIVKLAERPDYRQVWGNELGAFTLRDLAPGTYSLLVRCEGHTDYIKTGIVIPNPKVECLEIELGRGAWIEVTVVDADEAEGEGGIEVQIQTIKLDDPLARPPKRQLATTDDHGRALFTGVTPGTYSVFLLNRAISAIPEQQVYIPADYGMRLQFVIQPLNNVLVTVTTEKDEPINEVHVRMWPRTEGQHGTFREETDIEGEAVLTHVPAGQYVMKLWKNGFYREERDIDITTPSGEFEVKVAMTADPKDGSKGTEDNPTLEQIDQLSRGMRPSDIWKRKQGTKKP